MSNKTEEIIKKRFPFYDPNIYGKDVELNGETVSELMDEYSSITCIEFIFWKGRKGYFVQDGVTQHTTSKTPIWVRQVNQLIFSKPISTEELYNLYLLDQK